tara:strand:- start:190 stop:546 length:357 start_codon:yes stop_codon:yes gene_type:complete
MKFLKKRGIANYIPLIGAISCISYCSYHQNFSSSKNVEDFSEEISLVKEIHGGLLEDYKILPENRREFDSGLLTHLSKEIPDNPLVFYLHRGYLPSDISENSFDEYSSCLRNYNPLGD